METFENANCFVGETFVRKHRKPTNMHYYYTCTIQRLIKGIQGYLTCFAYLSVCISYKIFRSYYIVAFFLFFLFISGEIYHLTDPGVLFNLYTYGIRFFFLYFIDYTYTLLYIYVYVVCT